MPNKTGGVSPRVLHSCRSAVAQPQNWHPQVAPPPPLPPPNDGSWRHVLSVDLSLPEQDTRNKTLAVPIWLQLAIMTTLAIMTMHPKILSCHAYCRHTPHSGQVDGRRSSMRRALRPWRSTLEKLRTRASCSERCAAGTASVLWVGIPASCPSGQGGVSVRPDSARRLARGRSSCPSRRMRS